MYFIKWSVYNVIVVVLLVYVQKSFCSTSPCTFNTNCTCDSPDVNQTTVSAYTQTYVYCWAPDAQFPIFPHDISIDPWTAYHVVIEGAFQQVPSPCAFGNLSPRTVLLRRNATDMTLPLTVYEQSFYMCQNYSSGGSIMQSETFVSITFENFLGLTTVPPMGYTVTRNLTITNSNFSTLYDRSFLNSQTFHVTLDRCNIRTIDETAFYNASFVETLALPNNFLTDVPAEALSQISNTLQSFDISSNKLTSLTQKVFSNFSILVNYIFDNNPITNIPLGSLDGVKETYLDINSLPDLKSLDVSITIGMPKVGYMNITNCPQMATLEMSDYNLPESMYQIYSPASVQYISDNFKNWLSLRPFNTLYIASENYTCDSSMYWMAPFLCSQGTHIVIAENASCSNGKQMQQYLNESTNYVCGSSASSVSAYSMLVAFVVLLSAIFISTDAVSLAI